MRTLILRIQKIEYVIARNELTEQSPLFYEIATPPTAVRNSIIFIEAQLYRRKIASALQLESNFIHLP
jgi:hypothetical protein